MTGKRVHHGVTFAVLSTAPLAYSLLQSLVLPALPTLERVLHTSSWSTTGPRLRRQHRPGAAVAPRTSPGDDSAGNTPVPEIAGSVSKIHSAAGVAGMPLPPTMTSTERNSSATTAASSLRATTSSTGRPAAPPGSWASITAGPNAVSISAVSSSAAGSPATTAPSRSGTTLSRGRVEPRGARQSRGPSRKPCLRLATSLSIRRRPPPAALRPGAGAF
jgi:hypothetical protein